MDYPENIKSKKIFDRKTAHLKAQKYCAYQERSQQEVRDKLYEWGLHRDDVENVIVELISENFLNEERFAISYARGKFRIKKWGKIKIKQELKSHKISTFCINKALIEIDNEEYIYTLRDVISKREKTIKDKHPAKKKYKIISYAVSRGYEADLVKELLSEMD
jgi:regulatory protein